MNAIAAIANRTPLGFIQLRRDKLRMLISVCGIAFADILMFMQLGILNALFDTNTLMHRKLDADIVMIGLQAKQMTYLNSFPRRRLYQSLDVAGVTDMSPVYIDFAEWKHPETHKKTSMLFVGVDPDKAWLQIPELKAQANLLKMPDRILFDEASRGDYSKIISSVQSGHLEPTEIGRRTVYISGLFKNGASFATDGSIVTSDQNFLRLFPKKNSSQPSLGLIRIKKGEKPEVIVERLREYLPKDIKVMTKAQFVQLEIDYLNKEQPLGFVFGMGTIIGFIVGVVIVYQILSTDVNDHLVEYATFKAMGFSDGYLLSVVFEEALILASIGFIPGLAVALGLYALLRKVGSLPIYMPLWRLVFVFVLTVVMCAVSGAIATRRLRNADPAEIF